MGNIADIENITKSLNENPMFRLSLGSKELFHSNFLEFLWEQNPMAFLEMLSGMIPKDRREPMNDLITKYKNGSVDLELAREKEHFDLCMFHTEKDVKGRDIEIYDLIIENKVKSIPFKAQLDEYVEKIEKKQDVSPIYVLLSLARNFAEREKIGEKWIISSYDQLVTSIRSKYSIFCKYIKDKYIRDYCNFIESLVDLEDYIEKRNDLPNEQYELLRNIRLHDLCIKQYGSAFVGRLYNEIIEKLGKEVITFGKEDRDDTGHHIFLSSSYNNGKCTITAAIRNDSIFYIIQIEGNPFDGNDRNQYRHMINKINLAKDNSKRENNKKRTVIDAEQLEGKLLSEQYALDFIKFIEQFEVKDMQDGPIEDYCKYEPHVVYRYKTFNDSDFDKMLKVMDEDVINTCKQLNIN